MSPTREMRATYARTVPIGMIGSVSVRVSGIRNGDASVYIDGTFAGRVTRTDEGLWWAWLADSEDVVSEHERRYEAVDALAAAWAGVPGNSTEGR